MLIYLLKRFFFIKISENFYFFLIISFSLHIFILSFIKGGKLNKSQTGPLTLEVELVNIMERGGGGGGGGGGKGDHRLKIEGKELINEIRKLNQGVVVKKKMSQLDSSEKLAEEKEDYALQGSSDKIKAHEEDLSISGSGGGVGGGSGTGFGIGSGAGVGSGIGNGLGSGIGGGVGSGLGYGKGGVSIQDELREFQKRIKEQIERVKSYPLIARKNQYEGTTSCVFILLRNGYVKDIWIVEKSGYSILDEAAKKAIKDAEPYPPFPPSIKKDSIEVKVPLVFKLEEDLER